MRSLSGEVLHELPQILRHFLSFPAQDHTLVYVAPEGVHDLLLLLAAVTRFLARVVEDVLVDSASVFALLSPTHQQPILLRNPFQRLLAGSPWLHVCCLLHDIRNALQCLDVEVMSDGVQVRRRGFLWRIAVSLDCFIGYLFGLFFKAGGQLIFSDADFECGVDGAAFLIAVLTEYSLRVIDAALAFAASGEEVSTQQHLLLGGRLDTEVLVGAQMRQ